MNALAITGVALTLMGCVLIAQWALVRSRGDARWRAAGYGFLMLFPGLAAIAAAAAWRII